jgi:neutral amino acid transport system permease protein
VDVRERPEPSGSRTGHRPEGRGVRVRALDPDLEEMRVGARMRATVLAGLLTLAALLLVAPAAAQSTESVGGTLTDADREPVAGVTISVADPDGTEVGATETTGDGTWSIDLPASGDYVVTLDQDTLPDDVALTDPERASLEVTIRGGQDRTVLFATGEAVAGASALSGLLQRTVAGLRFGLIIAISAIGLSLIFGTTGLVNFAHGEFVAFGAIVAWFLSAPSGTGAALPLIAAAALAVLITGGGGGAVEIGLWRPLRRRRTGLIQMLVISIGLGLFLRFSLLLWFGGRSRPYFEYTIQQSLTFGPVRITPRDLFAMAIATLALVAVGTMLQRTRIGKAMRAVSDNRDLAESSGIDVQRVILMVWIMGAGLAGLGGVLYGLTETISYLMGFQLLLLMFAGIILGGLGTAYGAMLGSLVVGLVTELSTLYFSTELKFVWGLAVLILILLVRPQGILGRAERFG